MGPDGGIADRSRNQVGPHEFEPLRRFRNRGRCRACYVHEDSHPLTGWAEARPLGNKALPTAGARVGVSRREAPALVPGRRRDPPWLPRDGRPDGRAHDEARQAEHADRHWRASQERFTRSRSPSVVAWWRRASTRATGSTSAGRSPSWSTHPSSSTAPASGGRRGRSTDRPQAPRRLAALGRPGDGRGDLR